MRDPQSSPSPIVCEAFRQRLEQGEYYAAHEIMEEEWIRAGRPRGNTLHGLILLAVACEHQRRRNESGATRVFERALRFIGTDRDDFTEWCTQFAARILERDA